MIAKSTGCNPVIIRNLLGKMKKAGILNIQRGSGGATLRIDPKDISIWSVYAAVDPASFSGFIGLHPNPSNICPVGKNIHVLLNRPHRKIEEAVKQVMSEYTLANLIEEFQQLE
jgi:DNA-binding IscR family transcriptional regulator